MKLKFCCDITKESSESLIFIVATYEKEIRFYRKSKKRKKIKVRHIDN